MSKSPSKTYQNCSIENESPFQYCPNCGQKNTDGKITFSELWAEFKDAALNIDSRTWRTVKNLFIPGRLTAEYFAGKHRRYVHPLRLLIVTSVLTIIAMSFQGFQSFTNHSHNIHERILKNHERLRIYRIVKKITDNTHATFPAQQTEMITDTILTTLRDSMRILLFESSNEYANRYGDTYGDTINVNHYASFGSEKPEYISKRDFLYMEEAELVATYKKEAGILERLFFKQKIKLIKDESQIFATMVGHTTWAILLMMPCLALVLYFLYFRHSYFYIEHLIFAFHLQSFAFVVLTILIAGMNIFPWWPFIPFLAMIWIYLFFSMWKVYGQGIGKTVLKFLLLSISYGGLFVLILIGTIFMSLFLL